MGLWRGWRHNRVDVGERNAEVQGWAAGVVHADRSRRTRRPLGSKPKLWDLKGIVLAKLKDKAGWAVMKVSMAVSDGFCLRGTHVAAYSPSPLSTLIQPLRYLNTRTLE